MSTGSRSQRRNFEAAGMAEEHDRFFPAERQITKVKADSGEKDDPKIR
jgi:hypothetical protein